MKKTKKLLIIGTIFAVVASLGMLQTKVFADDDGYEEVPGDLNNVTVDDGTEETNTTNTTNTTKTNEVKNTTNTTNTTTNTTNNVVSLNTTNTANEAKTNHPQAGNFTEAKVIAGVSVAVIALAFAFAKMKKYSY